MKNRKFVVVAFVVIARIVRFAELELHVGLACE